MKNLYLQVRKINETLPDNLEDFVKQILANNSFLKKMNTDSFPKNDKLNHSFHILPFVLHVPAHKALPASIPHPILPLLRINLSSFSRYLSGAHVSTVRSSWVLLSAIPQDPVLVSFT